MDNSWLLTGVWDENRDFKMGRIWDLNYIYCKIGINFICEEKHSLPTSKNHIVIVSYQTSVSEMFSLAPYKKYLYLFKSLKGFLQSKWLHLSFITTKYYLGLLMIIFANICKAEI